MLNENGAIPAKQSNNGLKKNVTIIREPRAAWGGAQAWSYVVVSAGEWDARADRIDEARGIAKRRANGGKIIESWNTPEAKAARAEERSFRRAFSENKHGELA